MKEKIYKQIIELTPENDKLRHFFWGFVGALIGLICHFIFDCYLLIVMPITIVSILKEYFDYKGMGKVELLDFIFSIFPSISLTLIILL